MSGRREPVITVDGPAAAGKSTAARAVARRLGFRYLDTGALYRGLAWAVRQAGVGPEEGPRLAAVLERTTVEAAGDRLLVNGRDVAGEIRSPDIGELTSRLTTLRSVREKLTPIQRALAAPGGVVLEGRDTGTVVWPEAEIKFYLDASLETRARRRQAELQARGTPAEPAAVRDEVARRDRQDSERALSPLRKAEDAHVLDTTALSIDEVVAAMLRVVELARCCTGS